MTVIPSAFIAHTPSNPTSIPDNQIKCLFEDEQHRLWIGTLGGGLCIYDRDRDSFLRLEDLGIPSDFSIEPAILSFTRTGRRALGGNLPGAVVDRPEARTIRQFQTNTADASTLSNPTIQSIFEDAAGHIWLGHQ